MIKYAIFDMDGTLFDTEEMFERSWLITSAKYNLENADRVYQGVAGAPAEVAKNLLRENYGDRVDPDAFFLERTMLTLEFFENEGIPVKKGCFELLEFLREQKIPCAVATSTPRWIAEKNIKTAGVYDYFEKIVTGDMVKRGKPAPDIFIEAGRRLGACSEETIVCEDSINGLRGAYAAGMKPVFVFDRQVPDPDTRKMLFCECESLFDVIDIIKRENSI